MSQYDARECEPAPVIFTPGFKRSFCAQSRLQHDQALKKAFDLHVELNDIPDESESESLANFFTEPSGGRNVIVPSIRLGTDCSGIDTPVFTLKSLGIPFVHVFPATLTLMLEP